MNFYNQSRELVSSMASHAKRCVLRLAVCWPPYALCWPAGFLLYDPAPQATHKGWPYYIRAARAAGGAVV